MGANGERKVSTGDHSYMYITPRTLLGIIRLSQALAKLNFRNEVTQKDVDESLRLMDYSFQSLRNTISGTKSSQNTQRKQQRAEDEMTEIMHNVREVLSAAGENASLAMNEILKRI